MNGTEILIAYAATFMISMLVLYVLMVIANWKIFTKAGEAGWKSLIPLYNSYILFKISWKKSMFWITLAIGFVIGLLSNMSNQGNVAAVVIVSILSIATFVISIMQCNKLSKVFGHGIGFTIGLIFLSPIFMLILAFGSSQYIGKSDN